MNMYLHRASQGSVVGEQGIFYRSLKNYENTDVCIVDAPEEGPEGGNEPQFRGRRLR